MTPAARVAAAIECLDQVLGGAAAEKVLTTWGRSHRFAGSKDRAAIRDLVFDGLRRRRSYGALGGADSGRGLMLGRLRAAAEPAAEIFSGIGHAPETLSAAELEGGCNPQPGAEAHDCPDWLWDVTQAQLGADASSVWQAHRNGAPVGLRVNLAKSSVDEALRALQDAGYQAHKDDRSPSALVLLHRARGLDQLELYKSGKIELQDVGSQWVSDRVPLENGQTMLDFCAGGGGKTLAVAARVRGTFLAHDGIPQRLADLPGRAKRAGVRVKTFDKAGNLPACDVVVADVPCSGTGTWRRTPDMKWRFCEDDLGRVTSLQADIMDAAASRVKPGGFFVYATCSVLDEENAQQARRFEARAEAFELLEHHAMLPDDRSDGYFVAIFKHHK